jgi:hypothetical protein
MPARPLDPDAPPLGTLLPDFTVQTCDGRTIHRRDLKGRHHLVLCFAPLGHDDLTTFTALLLSTAPAWRAERAAVLVLVPEGASLVGDRGQSVIAEDHGARLRARFGVDHGAAIFIADRYGEIVYHAIGKTTVPVDDVLPTLELLEMRCSL